MLLCTHAAAATPQMSFRVVQALAGLGCGGVALDVLRARSGAAGGADEQDSAAALHEAHVGLQIRLSCNLITEAFMEVRAPCCSAMLLVGRGASASISSWLASRLISKTIAY